MKTPIPHFCPVVYAKFAYFCQLSEAVSQFSKTACNSASSGEVGVCLLCLAITLLFFSDGQKHKKSLRRKLDSLSKEKSKDKGTVDVDIFLNSVINHSVCTLN